MSPSFETSMSHKEANLFPTIDWDSAQRFLMLLKGADPICWQTIHGKKEKGKAENFHGTLNEVKAKLIQAQQNGCDIFVTVNRTDGLGRRTENVLAATAVFVDGDGLPLPQSWALSPHIIVQRDEHHWHAYWLIEPTEDLSAWTRLQKALAHHLGTDPKISDPPRVMRVPGFWHQKGEPVLVELVKASDPETVDANTIRRYTLEVITQAFSITVSDKVPQTRKHRGTKKSPQTSIVPLDLPENILTATQYLQAEAPVAVEGDQGDATTLHVAARLKDFGISPKTTVELMQDQWNSRCVPPWTREELTEKVRNAFTYCTNSQPGSASKQPRKPGRFEQCLLLLPSTKLGLAFDTFSWRAVLTCDSLPWKGKMGREITDENLRNIRILMINRWGSDPGKVELSEAAMALAWQHPFHPVVEYLNTLPQWDGVPRLDTWLPTYLGAADTPYTRAVGAKTLLAAVSRVHEPGCKFDTILVLEGQQGTGKSTAIKILAGESWYSDGALTQLNSADAVQQIQGVWIYELGEMVTLNKSEVDSLKAFASRAVDRARYPYERFTKDFPRQCIFIGTTNSEAYLRDLTGNRRIWPVKTHHIDTEGLQRDRDQLWVEADDRWRFGDASLELDPSLWSDAAQEQEQRLIEDPWEDCIQAYLDYRKRDRMRSGELLESALDLDPNQQHQAAAKRLRTIMTKLGWEYRKALRVTIGEESRMGAGYIKEGAYAGETPPEADFFD